MASVVTAAMDRGTKSKRDRYQALFSKLKSDRSSFDDHWQQIADFMLPRRPRFFTTDRNKGDRRNQNIIDSTGKLAQRTLGAGMHSGLTNPARPWMKLSVPDPDLRKFAPVKAWTHEVTQRMLTIFAETNIYNVLPLCYGDLGAFGTAAIGLLDDRTDLFRAFSYPIGSFAIGLDARGLATTFAMEYELTVRQVVEEFGVVPGRTDIDWSGISLTVKRLFDTGEYEAAVQVGWIVMPNDYGDRARLEAKFKPWSSCHFELHADNTPGKLFLRESGFDEFPVMVPRWDVTGFDAYGTDCPGMTALGDVKQLQGMQRKKGQLLQKAVDPPLKGPSHLRSRKISLLPGDFTATDERTGQSGLSPIHEVRLEGFQHLTADIQDVRYLIDRAFYADLFLMLANSDQRLGADRPTAREIEERHEEKLLMLGPVLERTNDELLDRIVLRTYNMMKRAGLVPEPPPDIQGVNWNVEYTSILHQAQKLVTVSVQDRYIQTSLGMIESLAQVAPDKAAEIAEKTNWMKAVDNYGEQLGVDPELVVDTDVALERIAEKRQAVQNMQDAAAAKDMAGAVATAGAKPIAAGSAIDELRKGLTGA